MTRRLGPHPARRLRLAAFAATLLSTPAALAGTGMHDPAPDPALADRVAALARAAGAEVGVAFSTLDGRDERFVNADAPFHAASTMKIAVMVELFRQADAGTLRLDAMVPVTNRFRSIVDGSPYELDASEDSDPEVYKAVGTSMTYRRLCEAMITVSSNLATNILIGGLGPKHVRDTVARLGAHGLNVHRGVEDDKAFAAGLNNTTTARGLQVLLAAIAQGRAGSRAATREMIDILARQKFNDAIPAGLAAGTRVAHKTGSITKIHHDAGIVYGARPYVLVVLTRGLQDQKASAALIAEITRVIDAFANRSR